MIFFNHLLDSLSEASLTFSGKIGVDNKNLDSRKEDCICYGNQPSRGNYSLSRSCFGGELFYAFQSGELALNFTKFIVLTDVILRQRKTTIYIGPLGKIAHNKEQLLGLMEKYKNDSFILALVGVEKKVIPP